MLYMYVPPCVETVWPFRTHDLQFLNRDPRPPVQTRLTPLRTVLGISHCCELMVICITFEPCMESIFIHLWRNRRLAENRTSAVRSTIVLLARSVEWLNLLESALCIQSISLLILWWPDQQTNCLWDTTSISPSREAENHQTFIWTLRRAASVPTSKW